MNDHQTRLLIDRLRRLQRTLHKGKPFLLPEGAITNLDVIERRLIEALRRDATGTVEHDGYPTGTVGSGGQDAAQSTTEGAALAGYRLDHPSDVEHSDGTWDHQPHDQHHELTTAAAHALQRAADAVADLIEKLDAIDRLATIPRTDPSGHCAACDRWVEGTANDRLRSGYCHTDYTAWVRAGRPDRAQFERQRRSTAAWAVTSSATP